MRQRASPALFPALFAVLTLFFIAVTGGFGSGSGPETAAAAAIPRDQPGRYGTAPPPGQVDLALRAPWSLITVTEAQPVADLAARIPGVEGVFRWDAASQSYESWRADLPPSLNALTTIEAGDAIWLRLAEDATYQQAIFDDARDVSLLPGWNLVGWTISETTAEAAVAVLSSQRLFTFDAERQEFAVYDTRLPAGPRTLTRISVGAGVWALVEEPTTVRLLPPLFGSIPAAAKSTASSTVAISRDGARLYTVNTDPESITVVDTAAAAALVEISTGAEPRTIALDPRGDRAYVSNFGDSSLSVLDVDRGVTLQTIATARSPYGVVVSPDAQSLYVAASGAGQIQAFDTATLTLRRTIAVEAEPRGLAINAEGTRLYATHFLSGRVSVIDLVSAEVIAVISTGGESSAAQFIMIDPSGEKAYVPHSRSRISNANLQFDTTVAPLVSVLDLETNSLIRRELLGLDAIDRPVGLPFAVAFAADGGVLYVVNSGSNDVSVVDLEIGLGLGHLEVGANPRGIVLSQDERTAWVYNLLAYTVSVIDLEPLAVTAEIVVSASPLAAAVQRGKEIFFSSDTPDIARDQWISCAACHFAGLVDGRTWPFSDGPRNTPPIVGLANSAPFHWSGDRVDLFDFQKTVRDVQGGTGLSEADNAALAAFLGFEQFAPSPNRDSDGSLSAAAERGEEIFFTNGCGVCHAGSAFTDGRLHNVGTGESPAENRGPAFDTPSLLGIHATAPYLHDGSAPTLRDVLITKNADDRHGGTAGLTEEEIEALVAFLQSLP